MNENNYTKCSNFVSTIRSMIQHEDQLVNHRQTWMLTLQGLLFAAVSFIWKIDKQLVLIIGLVGIISSISIGYHISRSYKAIAELLEIARNFKKNNPAPFELPPTIGARSKAIEFLVPGRLLPWIFGIAWVLILVRLASIQIIYA